ncbi:signal recognition particle protein [Myxococcota bacterium]|nr:signal recognition particle protein [Myxococcota bacterium]
MLEIVSKGFSQAKASLTGKATITEENITDALREIRVSLLEADVELGVVRSFLDRVKERAIGEVVHLETTQDGGKKGNKLKASPGEHFTLICQHELENLMGPVEEAPITYRRPYTTLMLVGLQGTGKTTTAAKLAKYLLAKGRKPMLVAADVYRPAAVEQLQQLGKRLNVPVFAAPGLEPPQVCQDALREAKRKKRDVIIFDTAGRLAIDDTMMNELEDIKKRTLPDEIFLVSDAMAGQDTVQTASEFNRRLDLSGFIMTKLDGDARGGAALSIKEVTGKPIKFLGMGEELDKLEEFRPEGLASRILGMGDIVGLMQDFEAVVDEKQAERDTKKLLRGEFTLDDFLSQLKMLKQMGSVKDIFDKFPIFGDAGMPDGAQVDDNAFIIMESLIHSMTKAERNDPKMIDDSRAKRIASGSGRKPDEVKDLVNRFAMMHQLMAGFASNPGMMANMPGFKQLGQMRKMKGMGTQDIFGDPRELERLMGQGGMPGGMPGMPGGMPGMPGGGMPGGMPGLPGGLSAAPGVMDGMGGMGMGAAPQMPGLPRGYTPPGMAGGGAKAQSTKERNKAKNKRKLAKKSRKKGRK